MTSNQNAAKANEIAEEKAKEEQRSNKARESEAERSNRANEALTKRGQDVKGLTDSMRAFAGLAGKINDPSWYNKDPQLVKDVASFSFGAPLGSTKDNFFETKKLTSTSEASVIDEKAVPGVMCLKLSTTIPNTTLMKTIGDKYYAFIRHANSGSRNYEANDLMMYLLAATECYKQLSHAAKIYSLLNTYKRENWYYAKGYLRSLGISNSVANDFLNHLSDFRSRLNVLIRRVNSFYIPNTFPLFARSVWLMLNIFKDHETKRSSNYIFAPNHILLYTETSDNLRLDASNINYTSYDNYMLQLENMVDRIYRSEDLGIMSGDILKAYKDTGIYSVNEISEDFHIEETYSAEVLSQINSATILGPCDLAYAGIFTRTTTSGSFIMQGKYDDLSTTNGYKLTCGVDTAADILPVIAEVDGQAYLLDATGESVVYPEHRSSIINMYKDEVTPDDVMVASRLKATTRVTKSAVDGVPRISLDSCGDSVVNTITVVRLESNNGVQDRFTVGEFFDGQQTGCILGVSNTLSNPIDDAIGLLPTFDWAPRIRLVVSYGLSFQTVTDQGTIDFEADNISVDFDNFDYANYMKISPENIANLHKVALMSMYDI